MIETVWGLTKDWEGNWAEWKSGTFTDLHTKEMEELSNGIYKKLNKMSRELKVGFQNFQFFLMIFNFSLKLTPKS